MLPYVAMRLRDLSERYSLKEEIGRGSIGIIHRADDLLLGRLVAVKIMRPELRNQERQRARFVREAELSGRLGHPNIVPIYDVCEIDGGPALVMGLLAGRSLRTLLRMSQIRIGRMLGWFTQVCNGVAFAHDQGVIHRDIKPAHIFVGDFGQVVLTDWGLAKQVRQGLTPPGIEELPVQNRGDVTRVGDVVGTPAYMAPEQAEGRLDAVDHRADIYALGAILYEVMTGTRPYEASRSIDVLREVRKGPPEPPSQRAPHREISAALEAVCMKAMAREPTQRFQSALDLAANIEAQFDARSTTKPSAGEAAPQSGPLTADVSSTKRGPTTLVIARVQTGARASVASTEPGAAAPISVSEPPAVTHSAAPHEVTSETTSEDPATALATGRADAAAWLRHLQDANGHASEARRLFANLPNDPPRQVLGELWKLEGQSRDALERAAYHFVQASEGLEKAGDGTDTRSAKAHLHRDAWRAAETHGDLVSAQFHRALAEGFDDGALAGELARRAALTIETSPPGAVVDLSTVDDRGTVFSLGARLQLGKTPLVRRTVSATRAWLRLTSADGLAVHLPLKLSPGESRILELVLPRSSQVPPGFVFIAGGRYVMGTDDRAPGAGTPREVEVASFCMAKSPVTCEAYFEFLEDLLAAGIDAEPHLPRRAGEPLVTISDRRVAWRHDIFSAPEAPMRFVHKGDASAYAAWLGGRHGAALRLPTEEEWEYAAGGADGRAYPWGDRFAPGLADNRWRRAKGPAPLTGFPEDTSPLGMRNVAGGVSEWTSTGTDEEGRVIVRGGSWRARPDQCRIAARATMPPGVTHEAIGIRLAADVPISEPTGVDSGRGDQA